jgi:pyrroloquinoline quinone (PQQ) biosynthesis protein C
MTDHLALQTDTLSAANPAPVPPGLSSQLYNQTYLLSLQLRAVWSDILEAPDASERVRAWMKQVYLYLRHSCPLMVLAQDKLRLTRPNLAEYLEHHTKEEADHDVWMRRDLSRLGMSDAEIDGTLPWPETLALVGSQYAFIADDRPAALFGYIFVMESTAPSLGALEILKKAGIPEAALFTLREHSDLDTGHVQELAGVIDSIRDPLSTELVRTSCEVTCLRSLELVQAVARGVADDATYATT